MEHTPPLPSGFNINGYLIQSLKQTAPLCHVYYVSDANHVPYLLREFCPQGLAVRDPESGKLRYPENTDIEREVLPLKNNSSRSGHPPGGAPPERSTAAVHSRNRGGARPCGFPSPASEKEKLRWPMAPYPAPAGRRMRNLLLHPDNFGKIRLSAGTGRPPIRQGKEESCQTGKESRTARRKGGNPSGTEKRRARLPGRRRGTAEKNTAAYFLRRKERKRPGHFKE